jgi:hypothetical protein
MVGNENTAGPFGCGSVRMIRTFLLTLLIVVPSPVRCQTATGTASQVQSSTNSLEGRIKALETSLRYTEERLAKAIDDLMWMRRVEDLAVVDKVRYVGPPPRVTNNPTGQGAGNPLVMWAYTFIRDVGLYLHSQKAAGENSTGGFRAWWRT